MLIKRSMDIIRTPIITGLLLKIIPSLLLTATSFYIANIISLSIHFVK